ncbi:ROK family protein [Deinococcus knuensis]|uniref:Glucokinase n=1 Tax=Deinococcus knuensis TaxID=1837380 RepID=A0ABQ2SF81_9DEIO|nr:ROK family protein [Deinococcus knuensis]GGS25269.1 glucokinase [Deinococcus knuensis]
MTHPSEPDSSEPCSVSRRAVAVALDIGGSHVTAAPVDLRGRAVIAAPIRLDLSHDAPHDTLIGGWAEAALAALAGAGEAVTVTHLGLAVPGPFDAARGVSGMTHKFRALHGQDARAALSARLRGTPLQDTPILFGNDADLFALGEWWAGAGEQLDTIGVTLGTGIGSGFIRAGQVQTGGPGVPPGGELWNTPFRGATVEDAVSGAALTRLAHDHLGITLDARQLAALPADQSSPVWTAFGQTLGDALSPWVQAFGPQRVVLGGNISRAFGQFGTALQSRLPPGTQARQSRHFEHAALLGAAQLPGPDNTPH